MQNVFDLKKDKNLNFILPLNTKLIKEDSQISDVVIVIHLFYESRLEQYLRFIECIPAGIDVLFTTSNPLVHSSLERWMKRLGRQFKVVLKNNRGRDVSGLLVACRNEILKYKYVCFLHDKKEKSEEIKEDIDIFINCLWENTVGSTSYILNIINLFEQNPKLGVLLPPEPLSGNCSFLYSNTWDLDFELMQSLSERLHLNCDLDKEKKPLSLGTVFWARVDALRKLFEVEWRYEDFDEEPLPVDGTISHAIERSFAYIAQDAGYETGIVMTDRFAGQRLDDMQEVLTDAFGLMKLLLNITTVNRMKNRKSLYVELLEFVSKYLSIYIYGAGVYGRQCLNILNLMSYKVNGFLVSDKDESKKEIQGNPVVLFSDAAIDDNTGIIIAVSDRYRKQITEHIKVKYPKFDHIFYYDL